ncbi:MAG: four helix bundle protein [Phycisphaerae bacterium]
MRSQESEFRIQKLPEGMSKSFQDLVVWQRSHELVLAVYRLTGTFPREELFGLTSQLRRAAVSVPANIAEAFRKDSRRDKARVFNIAQCSAEETRYFLLLARDLGLAETTKLQEDLDEITRMLAAYVRRIRANEGPPMS